MNPYRVIVEAATILASGLPAETVEAVAGAILMDNRLGVKAEIAKRVPHHHHRDQAIVFVDSWLTKVPEVEASVVAVALQTAALSEQKHRDSQSVELVW